LLALQIDSLNAHFLCYFLCFQPSSRNAFSSSRVVQPAAFSSWQDGGTHYTNAMVVAVAAGSVFLGAGSVAYCEMPRNVKDPETFPTADERVVDEPVSTEGPTDPMTLYAKFAAKREMEEAENTVGASAQATSPAEQAGDALPSKYISDMSAEELRIEEATRKAKQHSGGIKVFSGNGNMQLSLEIAQSLGINLGKATVARFADGECNVVINENVRGKDCYIIQPTCPPVNDNIMELLLMVSTLRRASARRITVVIPYYGYARQDRKMQVK
jgi:hypothetical protein